MTKHTHPKTKANRVTGAAVGRRKPTKTMQAHSKFHKDMKALKAKKRKSKGK